MRLAPRLRSQASAPNQTRGSVTECGQERNEHPAASRSHLGFARARSSAAIHSIAPVKQLVANCEGCPRLEHLPAYAPELKSVEYLKSHLTQNKIGNLLVRDGWDLSCQAEKALCRMFLRSRTIRPLRIQAELSL